MSSEWIFFLGDIYQILMAGFKAWKMVSWWKVVNTEEKRDFFCNFAFKKLCMLLWNSDKHQQKHTCYPGSLLLCQSDRQGIQFFERKGSLLNTRNIKGFLMIILNKKNHDFLIIFLVLSLKLFKIHLDWFHQYMYQHLMFLCNFKLIKV